MCRAGPGLCEAPLVFGSPWFVVRATDPVQTTLFFLKYTIARGVDMKWLRCWLRLQVEQAPYVCSLMRPSTEAYTTMCCWRKSEQRLQRRGTRGGSERVVSTAVLRGISEMKSFRTQSLARGCAPPAQMATTVVGCTWLFRAHPLPPKPGPSIVTHTPVLWLISSLSCDGRKHNDSRVSYQMPRAWSISCS